MNPHSSSGKSTFWRLLRPALLLVPLAVALPAASAYQAGYAYDDAGRLVQADYGGGQTIAYATDANGNLTTRSAVAGLGPYALAYAAQPGGLLVGDAAQSVAHGGTGTAVVAAPQLHYAFAGWSDGFGNAERTDSNVVANLSVVARFVPLLAAGGTPHWWLADHGYSGDFDVAEASDDDVDGFTAGQEFAADTDPGNPGEFPCVDSALSPWMANAIRFQSSTGRLYVLQGRTPVLEAWSNLPGRGPRLGLGGADGMEPLADTPAQLYRLRVQVP